MRRILMKTGLVLEGGASRAYFSIGAMDALLDLGIYTDYVIGASAGIANGISYVSRQKGRSLELGLKYLHDKRYMGFRHLLNRKNGSYYNIKFVFDEIPNKYVPFDYEKFRKFNSETVAAVTNIETGKPEYINIDGSDKEWTAVVASCALPLMFKPINIGGKLYMDGGISDSIPFERAFESGCDKAIVIVTRERGYCKENEPAIGISSFLYRKYPQFAAALHGRADMYNRERMRLFKAEKEGKALVIAPENTDGWTRTEKSPERLKFMYDDGYNAVMARADEIKAFMKNTPAQNE